MKVEINDMFGHQPVILSTLFVKKLQELNDELKLIETYIDYEGKMKTLTLNDKTRVVNRLNKLIDAFKVEQTILDTTQYTLFIGDS